MWLYLGESAERDEERVKRRGMWERKRRARNERGGERQRGMCGGKRGEGCREEPERERKKKKRKRGIEMGERGREVSFCELVDAASSL